MAKYSAEELNSFTHDQLVDMFLAQQDQVTKLNENLEVLIEQIRLANQHRFGRKTEKLDEIAGQMSLFNEAEAYADDDAEEPDIDEVIITVKSSKSKGKRKEDLKELPHIPCPHSLTDAQLDEYFGEGCWRRLKTEEYQRVKCEPAVYTVEDHSVDVAVGTSGDHQDEFLRGDRPKDLLRNSIVTPSLMAAILNAKYVNAQPLYRIENQFRVDGIKISRQTMANWTINISEKYLEPFWRRLKEELIELGVIQADETPVQVINDNDPEDPNSKKSSPGHKNYMWLYRSGEFEKDRRIVLYDYKKTRHHKHPKEFLKDFHGTLMSDGLQQYFMLENLLDGYTNANCWVHARRAFADAVKAIGKGNTDAIKRSLAYQALIRIKAIFDLEGTLKDLTPEKRLKERKKSIEPLVDEFFAWVKARLEDTSILPKSRTAEGMNYCVNKEQQLRVFLSNGMVPIDNSASERAIRPFTIGRKNWVIIDSVKGARASAVIYSIVETAKLNDLNCYQYFNHLLTELPKLCDENGNIDTSKLDPLLPWSDQLPDQCHKPRR